MKNIKTLIIVLSCLIIIIIGATVYEKKPDVWEKIADRPVSQYTISDTTLLEFDSFDNQTNKEKITLDIQGAALHFSVDGAGNVLPIADPQIPPVYVTQSEDKQLVSFNFNNDLYTMHVAARAPVQISYDSVDGYDKKQLVSQAHNGNAALSWVSASLMNDSASYIVYESNRRGFMEGEPHVDIWGKDMATGDERILVRNALIYGWVNNHTFAYQRGDAAGTYNVINGENRETGVSTGFYGITSSVVIEATATSIIVTDLISKDIHEMKLNDSISVFNGTVSRDGNYTAAFFYENNDQSPRIAVVDLRALKLDRIIDPPAAGSLLFNHTNKLIVWSYEEEATWIQK